MYFNWNEILYCNFTNLVFTILHYDTFFLWGYVSDFTMILFLLAISMYFSSVYVKFGLLEEIDCLCIP